MCAFNTYVETQMGEGNYQKYSPQNRFRKEKEVDIQSKAFSMAPSESL
jgi:hypothetical protein